MGVDVGLPEDRNSLLRYSEFRGLRALRGANSCIPRSDLLVSLQSNVDVAFPEFL